MALAVVYSGFSVYALDPPSLNRHIFTQEMLDQPGNNREPCLMSALYICVVIILP